MKLFVDKREKINDHFDVPPDCTDWRPNVYSKRRDGWSPNRSRANFGSIKNALIPKKTEYASNITKGYGIYIIAFDLPEPYMYVGIAANDSKLPEGIINRIRKHRVKVTGSNVGSNSQTTGGVHHPIKWRYFAQKRAQFFYSENKLDVLEDACVMWAWIFVDSYIPFPLQQKKQLEIFESAIINNERGIRDEVVSRLWPGRKVDVTILNEKVSNKKLNFVDEVHFYELCNFCGSRQATTYVDYHDTWQSLAKTNRRVPSCQICAPKNKQTWMT